MNGPAVSVVIPTHNRADLVTLAARSCLERQSVDLELIVVDDGGTDNTEEALSTLSGPIRYIRQDWAGRAVARNHGASLARAPAVAFLDSDDLSLPGRFARQLGRLEGNVAVWGQVEIIDADGLARALETASYQQLVAAAAAKGVTPERLALANRLYAGSTLLVRKDVFTRLGGFDPAFRVTEDVEFSLRLAREGTLAFEPEPVAAIRMHSGNSRIEEMFREHVALDAKLLSLCTAPGERRLRARLLSDQARAHWSLGEIGPARRSSIAAVRQDVTVLAEQGFAKRLLGSMLPADAADRARRLARRFRTAH
jgi:glycosyltransferase involved in cell wall biosynthesis